MSRHCRENWVGAEHMNSCDTVAGIVQQTVGEMWQEMNNITAYSNYDSTQQLAAQSFAFIEMGNSKSVHKLWTKIDTLPEQKKED